ncbi:MAG: DUF4290 domain-containing protein [Bacteroidia bacterium]
MKYYVSSEPLRLREYGRNVQQMIDFAKTIEDRDERSAVIEEIVRIMNALNPSPKDTEDYRRKMWDHMFLMAEFDLDVEAPFPIPTKEEVIGRPTEHIGYYKGKARYRQYGQNIEKMIDNAIEMENPEKKEAYINLIANSMMQFLRYTDRYSSPEEVIADQINELSRGKLNVKAADLVISAKAPVPLPTFPRNNKGKKKGGGGKKRGRSNSNSNSHSNRRRSRY